MPELKPVQAHYRKINPKCGYCGKPATIIRVAIASDRSATFMTMCEADAHGERSQCGSELTNTPGTGDFYDLDYTLEHKRRAPRDGEPCEALEGR